MAMADNMAYTKCDLFLSYLGEKMASGIYRIFSIATTESYYGSSNNIPRRFIEHRSLFRRGSGNHRVRSLIKEYGMDNLKFEILEECLPIEFEHKEKEYISKDEKSLNVWVLPFSSKGCNLGESVKGKHHKGRPYTEEHRKKMSQFMKEYYLTYDGPQKGKPLSEETRKKVSDGLRRYFSTHPGVNKGKAMSEETKRKISEAHKKRRGVL